MVPSSVSFGRFHWSVLPQHPYQTLSLVITEKRCWRLKSLAIAEHMFWFLSTRSQTMAASSLICWYMEKSYSVQSLNTVVEPKKRYGEFHQTGDVVKAKYRGTAYPALLVKIDGEWVVTNVYFRSLLLFLLWEYKVVKRT